MANGIIGTRMKTGQGFGNQLFCYISTRCLAKQKNFDFSILSPELLQKNLMNEQGIPFMNLSYGVNDSEDQFSSDYQEKEDRLYLGNSLHDINHGVFVSGVDSHLLEVKDTILIEGNLQDPGYFSAYKEEIKEWLKVEELFDSKEYSRENLCIINIRGGEYSSSPELYLRRKYYLDAIKYMKKIRQDMEFVIITDNVADANRTLPEYRAFHFSTWKDYVSIKNAQYLIISNSSFAFFAAYTSDTVKKVIAPKYWARHNVSDGYWASEQNIYDEFTYLSRDGKLATAMECRLELQKYKEKSSKYKHMNQEPTRVTKSFYQINARFFRFRYYFIRACRSLKRRLSGGKNGV